MGLPENIYDTSATGAPDEWGTPAEILDPIYKHFGRIGLDPCGNQSRLLQADRTVLLPDDGILADWNERGLVFVNPPYSNCARWMWKATQSPAEGGGDEIVALLPVRTSAGWWKQYIWPADVILFYGKRVKYHGAKYTAPFHSALVYWGDRTDLFLQAFPGHEALVYVDEDTYRRRPG
jgi:hypothetical protein